MKSRIEQALASAPEALSNQLAPIVLADDFDATLSVQQFEQLLSATGLSDKELRVALLPFAAAYSYAPISEFYVGAIVRGLSGRLYFGANMEFLGVQLGQTVHAEQSAISHAWMKGERGLTDITINFSPCGHCRQFMNELSTAKELKVQLPEREEKSLHEYLPEAFGPADLGITSGLMAEVKHQFGCDDSDTLIQKAVDAMNMSHAPYTNNLSGLALELTDGRVFQGAYAENAAFNPSLPPLQVALIQVLLAGETFDKIKTAALVENSEGKISHLADTQSTLEALNPDIPLSFVNV
ncbi:cytidine deaminase [Vibrio alginolyticus]|uniref:cytidine deaminase n=1 Tax=Vibrio sp. B1FLJ16 TaxID=2751178 RepID=UPI0015F65869|nr:cytidine deaminase [Vibrio sp. B1FLJ16]CAD7804545.1 This enzyme scavenges exogenous and endogenous cytidine and 2'-deoxycytidine for UMP synthesis [Vibrio sp. B1FLJ16]CAD7804745.1 This enzyme scavenges exogenous and endogenous cytidine and 2'-deoxycytidine for UMP synthesis [Vibrio sp. B1FLJ16]CAE6897593.1 This enzyme scavenges exogenous and endogenous cytidine and 2'-deoxycytidine for UMP synthesis [Vibrio sp. B1FLJ16]CAE6899040.1 This enzyme scavenges exogenous and endogenous cytidine and 